MQNTNFLQSDSMQKSYYEIKIGTYRLIGLGLQTNGKFTGLIKNKKHGNEFKSRGFYIGNNPNIIKTYYKEGSIMSVNQIKIDEIKLITNKNELTI